MKFTNYLKDIQHVSIYPLCSLLIFTAVFAVVLLHTFLTDKGKMEDHAHIPLK